VAAPQAQEVAHCLIAAGDAHGPLNASGESDAVVAWEIAPRGSSAQRAAQAGEGERFYRDVQLPLMSNRAPHIHKSKIRRESQGPV